MMAVSPFMIAKPNRPYAISAETRRPSSVAGATASGVRLGVDGKDQPLDDAIEEIQVDQRQDDEADQDEDAHPADDGADQEDPERLNGVLDMALPHRPLGVVALHISQDHADDAGDTSGQECRR